MKEQEFQFDTKTYIFLSLLHHFPGEVVSFCHTAPSEVLDLLMRHELIKSGKLGDSSEGAFVLTESGKRLAERIAKRIDRTLNKFTFTADSRPREAK